MGKKIIKTLLVGLVILMAYPYFLIPVPSSPSSLLSINYETLTFQELGFSTSTYHYGDTFSLDINCSGSDIDYYEVKLFIHKNNQETTFTYWLNNGVSRSSGDYFGLGWRNITIEPGHFMNGTNKLFFTIYNSPKSDTVVRVGKYFTFFADSYIIISHENDVQTAISTSEESSSNIPVTTYSQDISGGFPIELLFGILLVSSLFIGVFLLYQQGYFIGRKQKMVFVPNSSTLRECMICKEEHTGDTPHMKCEQCGQLVCVDAFANMVKAGRKTCPYCEGKLTIV